MSPEGKIIVVEKPDSVSWDVIHDVLWAAHKDNREKGMYMRYPSLSGEQLKEKVGINGKCFVAFYKDNVVGTCSFKLIKRNRWYAKGRVAYYLMEGVLPEFQGLGVYGKLMEAREEHVRSLGIQIAEMDTAEYNKEIQAIVLHYGFKYVKFYSYPSGKHYSVVLAKWFNNCPFSNLYCKWRFYLSRFEVKLKFKPGRIKRFNFLNYK